MEFFTDQFFQYFQFFISILLITESGIAGPKKNIAQSFEEFYLMPLKKGEIAFMPLGIYSNIIMKTQGEVILFDPPVLIESDQEILKARGVLCYRRYFHYCQYWCHTVRWRRQC